MRRNSVERDILMNYEPLNRDLFEWNEEYLDFSLYTVLKNIEKIQKTKTKGVVLSHLMSSVNREIDSVLIPLTPRNHHSLNVHQNESQFSGFFTIDLFNGDYLSKLIQEVDHIAAISSEQQLHADGINLNHFGFNSFMSHLTNVVMHPILERVWPNHDLHFVGAKVARYVIGDDENRVFNTPQSDVTLNVCIGKHNFGGGELTITKSGSDIFRLAHPLGKAILSIGMSHVPPTLPVTRGQKYTLMIFWKSFSTAKQFGDLLSKLQAHILSFLSFQEISRFERTCKNSQKLVNDEQVWKNCYEFMFTPIHNLTFHPSVYWKNRLLLSLHPNNERHNNTTHEFHGVPSLYPIPIFKQTFFNNQLGESSSSPNFASLTHPNQASSPKMNFTTTLSPQINNNTNNNNNNNNNNTQPSPALHNLQHLFLSSNQTHNNINNNNNNNNNIINNNNNNNHHHNLTGLTPFPEITSPISNTTPSPFSQIHNTTNTTLSPQIHATQSPPQLNPVNSNSPLNPSKILPMPQQLLFQQQQQQQQFLTALNGGIPIAPRIIPLPQVLKPPPSLPSVPAVPIVAHSNPLVMQLQHLTTQLITQIPTTTNTPTSTTTSTTTTSSSHNNTLSTLASAASSTFTSLQNNLNALNNISSNLNSMSTFPTLTNNTFTSPNNNNMSSFPSVSKPEPKKKRGKTKEKDNDNEDGEETKKKKKRTPKPTLQI